jgi:hypothetical protein
MGRPFHSFAFGKIQEADIWTFAPASLRIACDALGLDDLQAFDLAQLPTGPAFSHILLWADLVSTKKPLRCTHEQLAVLISTGVALHAREIGSSRGIADLILFGPAPLSHYPRSTPIRTGDLDYVDLRRIGTAGALLQKARSLLPYHDTTVALRHRLDEVIAELDSWFES